MIAAQRFDPKEEVKTLLAEHGVSDLNSMTDFQLYQELDRVMHELIIKAQEQDEAARKLLAKAHEVDDLLADFCGETELSIRA